MLSDKSSRFVRLIANGGGHILSSAVATENLTEQLFLADHSRNHTARPRRVNLAEGIVREIRGKLTSGELCPGDRLPTEKALSQRYGVSRAVVREAIAALRSEGLVVARQGSGAFVAEKPPTDLRQNLFLFEPEKLSSIIEVLELRAAVESEAAALAAERASPAELAKINECHQTCGEAVARGDQAEEQDYALHLAIVESTHNRQFVEFFRFLGGRTIPRAQALMKPSESNAAESFLQRIHQEHAVVVDAIVKRDAVAARTAMTAHLKGSQERYSRLSEIVDLCGTDANNDPLHTRTTY